MHELFEIGADVDVDALMASIRAKVKKRKELSAEQSYESAPSLQSAHVAALIEEIRNGELLVDRINQVPQKRRGLTGTLEFSVKRFLKWLVHWNTEGQAGFNRSTVQALELIAKHLQETTKNREETHQKGTDTVHQLNEQMRNLTAAIEEVRSQTDTAGNRLSELRWQVSRDFRQLQQDTARQVDLAAQHVREQIADFNQRNSAFERDVEKDREEIAQIIERTNQRISELAQKADANGTRASGLEQRMTDELLGLRSEANRLAEQASRRTSHDLDEMRMRLLRAERNLRKAMDLRLPRSSEQSPKNLAHQGQQPNGQKERSKGPTTEAELAFDYFMFEHRFRGSVSDIKSRQSVYLDLFSPRQTVVDLGCGR